MPILTPLANLPGGGGDGNSPPGTPGGPPTPTAQTYMFLVGWILLILLLTWANRTRLGHVLIYYSLLLIILLIVVTESATLAPLFSVQTVGELAQNMTAPKGF